MLGQGRDVFGQSSDLVDTFVVLLVHVGLEITHARGEWANSGGEFSGDSRVSFEVGSPFGE